MDQYLHLLRDVYENGRRRSDRTGVGTSGVFGRQLRCDLSKGFPLVTTKKVFFRGVVAELLWFLAGDTNEHTLSAQNVNIWRDWAKEPKPLDVYQRLELLRRADCNTYLAAVRVDHTVKQAGESHMDFIRRDIQADVDHYTPILDAAGIPMYDSGDGNLGRIYGAQWRSWRAVSGDGTAARIVTVDQIANLISNLQRDPTSRRHIVTAWNPGELDQMALPPCHCLFQFYCEPLTEGEREELWELKTDRKITDTNGASLIVSTGHPALATAETMDDAGIPRYRLSCQLYQRSADLFLGVPFNIASYSLLTMMVAQCVGMVPGEFVHTFGDLHIYDNHREQVAEQLQREPRQLPRVRISKEITDIFSFKAHDFALEGYDPHPAIRGEVAV